MKRLAYLRSEAADFVDAFEESVKEMEEKLGGKQAPENSSNLDTKNNVVTKSEVSTSRDLLTTNYRAQQSHNEKKADVKPESLKNSDENSVTPAENDVEGHYKKLWRTIARLTHPDVVGGDSELIALYKAASAAHEKGSRGELLDIASELSVQINDPHPRMLSDAVARCAHYEGMIKKIGGSIAWQWKNAEESKKSEILDLIKRSRDKNVE
jgi:hypothetical protein